MTTELLCLSDFVRDREAPSKIVFGKMVVTKTWMVCPYCDKAQKVMDHWERRTCTCGLQMCVLGNALHVHLPYDNDVLDITPRLPSPV